MGRNNTLAEKQSTISWARKYRGHKASIIGQSLLRAAADASEHQLKRYFALAALSRSTTSPNELVKEAWDLVFRVRVQLEASISRSIATALQHGTFANQQLFSGSFFGASKKQGVSVRLPLTACRATSLCGAACYAHDVLDAAPASIVRGVVNGLIAKLYEEGDDQTKLMVADSLRKHTAKAVKAALAEVEELDGWTRAAYIRFAHVGEIAPFSCFANALAQQVADLSNGDVKSVVYTRHPNASKLDGRLFVVNFTLDRASMDRREWAPESARLVFSAFNGEVCEDVDVNFLEHHRWSHASPIGTGRICPATAPETVDRTCDAVKCDRCFRQSEIGLVQLGVGMDPASEHQD
ncbi:hypothetical protein OAF37_03345 [Rubripirellula sp.]|nr:hypothetical protein [Rubripirellula sp.]MDB4645072.1 hypothetical protein [Rubripirellula sp.]